MEFVQRERNNLFPTCALANGKLYAFTSFKRLPIKEDLLTGEIAILDNLRGYDPLFVSDSMLSVGNDIFALELNGKRLLKYDTEASVCQYFSISCHRKEWDNYAVFAQYGKNLYVIPRCMDQLIKFDFASGKMYKDSELHSKLNIHESNMKDSGNVENLWYGFQDKNMIRLFRKKSNLQIVYDMEQNTWKKYELSVEINDCVHAMQYDGKLYILSSEGSIYSWDMICGQIQKIADCTKENTGDNVFSRIAITDKNIFLLPALGEDIFLIDLHTKQISRFDSYPDDFRYCAPDGWSKYYGYCEDDSNYYFAMRSMNYILTLSKRDGKSKWVKPKAPFYERYRSAYIKYNRKMLDEEECFLKEMIDNLKSGFTIDRHKDYDSEGKKIWNYVK